MRGVAKNVALVGVQGLAALAHHLHRPKPGLQRSLYVLVDPQLCPGPLPPACNRAAARTHQCTVYGTQVCTYDQNSTCMLLHSHKYCQKPTLPGSGASRGSNVQGQLPCAHRLSDSIAGQVGSNPYISGQAAGRNVLCLIACCQKVLLMTKLLAGGAGGHLYPNRLQADLQGCPVRAAMRHPAPVCSGWPGDVIM